MMARLFVAAVLLARSALCITPPDAVSLFTFEGSSSVDRVGPNHGTNVNGITYSNMIMGGGVNFQGAQTSRVEIGSSGIRTLSNYTFAVWINCPTNATGTDNPIFSIGSRAGGGTNYFVIGAERTTRKMALESSVSLLYATNQFSFNVWQHIAVAVETTTATFYVQGEFAGRVSSANVPKPSALIGTPAFYSLGCRNRYGLTIDGQRFNGAMDEALFIPRAVSAQEIAAIYYSRRRPSP